MKHSNIAFFIPHVGCPHQCSFCNQNSISSAQELPTKQDVIDVCKDAAKHLGNRVEQTEIAFFGGSFTAINREYMISLAEAAKECIDKYGFYGIRCSTRPDAVNKEVLNILDKYGLTSVELGCQSMDNNVLQMNNRGHTAEHVVKASKLIKNWGLELGHQIMVGLYGDTEKTLKSTATKLVDLEPDTMRIYPTVVIDNTYLATLWRNGTYEAMEFDDGVRICSDLISFFEKWGIDVIRVGLHASETLEKDMLAGIYHPAFREICESKIMYDGIVSQIIKNNVEGSITVQVNPKDISKAVGQKRSNILKLEALGYNVKIVQNANVPEKNFIVSQ